MANVMTLGQDRLKVAVSKYHGDREQVMMAIVNENGHHGAWNAVSTNRSQGKVKLHLEMLPDGFIEHMLEVAELTTKQRLDLLAFLGVGTGVDWEEELSSPSDVHDFLLRLGNRANNVMTLIAGRWYPVTFRSNLHNIGEGRGKVCVAEWTASIGPHERKNQYGWFPDDFERMDERISRPAREVFEEISVRELDSDELTAHADRVYEAIQVGQRTGAVYVITGQVLQVRVADKSTYWSKDEWTTLDLGLDGTTAKAVVDQELEVPPKQDNSSYWWSNHAKQDSSPLPFVRVFSLSMKRWVFADVRDIEEYVFDGSAMDKLVLPPETKSVMRSLFEAETSSLTGDLIAGKHGGMIVLANGPTGTGKTLTAEVCAEHTRRPLYVMEMAELGVDVNRAEARLERIFNRVTRWNAVLLMDECDIFLQERDKDLTHNVMVGIFLRLMDYYHGLMFLTSNRGDVIDEAFASRITLRFDYQRLDRPTRLKVWRLLCEAAGVTINGHGLTNEVLDIELNGRQIRNMVRLIKVLHGDHATNEQVSQVIRFACV